ncbi:hypothetical protein [Polaribacter sp. Asnod1-A03]|uniref:hypothetical protein n=1 Tax=Polaribacter sp. Asnod1-A03 TaxID=3160581 RepID=UPI003863C966
MKNTLEYKILKHLKDNDNGDFINVTNLIVDRKLLESKLHSLAEEPEKYISFISPYFFFGVTLSNKENNELKAKIEINGILLLDKIEKGDKNITENIFNGNFNGTFIQDSLLDKSFVKQKTVNKTEKEPSKKSWIEIASLVIGSIIGLIGIWEFIIKKLL